MDTFIKIFDFCSRFARIWLKSLQSANMTPKICFLNIFNMYTKKGDFKSVGKVANRFTRTQLEG
jgi:hypothetical protein